MTPTQLRIAIKNLGFAQSDREDDLGISAFARWLPTNLRTVHRWLDGDARIPPALAKLLRLMARLNLKPEDV